MHEVGCKLKYLKVLAIGLLALAGGGAAAATPEVQEAQDLQTDAREAAARRLVILLAFTADYCQYCLQVEEWFLVPTLISGDYDDKVIIRKVPTDSAHHLVDFDGTATDSDRLAARYGVRMVPTLVFLDAGGLALTEPMVGLTTPDFYGGYLDERVHEALERIRGNGVGSSP